VGRHPPQLTDTKNQKKTLDMICRPDKNAVARRNYHAMNTNNAVLSPQIRGRSFRSLLVVTAAALILTGFMVPRADATVISYFNFEDSVIGTRPPSNTPDLTPDFVKNDPGDEGVAGNPGGGEELSTSGLTINTAANTPATNFFAVTPGLSINATANDSDTPSNFAIGFSRTSLNTGEYIQFSVNTQFYANMSLSFGFSNNGNGFSTVVASYSLDGGATFVNFGTATMATGVQPPISFAVPAAVNQFGFVIFRLTFSGGFSNGNDTQTVIDNIRLDGTFVPEPATAMGGLLGVFGLCWHQRQRLVRFLRLRPA